MPQAATGSEMHLIALLEDICKRVAGARQTLSSVEYRLNGPKPAECSSEVRKSPESVREWVREIHGLVIDIESIAVQIDNSVGFASLEQASPKAVGISSRY